jgi:hypothetical protein
MARPPNYGQERAERARAKDRKRAERLQRREADAEKRKAEREGLLHRNPEGGIPPSNETEKA